MFPSVLCWLSDVKDIYSIKNLCHLSPEVKFQNRWRQITERELGNPGSTMGTWCMLPARYCPLAYYIVKHIKSLRLSLFGHVARMNELTDTSRILFVQPPDNWGKPPGGHTPRDSKCLQWPVLICNGAVRSQGDNSEPTFW